jgi:excinuclease ABC subunit C
VQSRQDINVEGLGDADVIAAHQAGGMTAIQVFFFRGGRNYGNRPYFPRHDRAQSAAEVLAGFIGQFYEDRPAPPLLLLSEDIAEADLLAEALSQKAGHKVRLWVPERGDKRKPVEHALTNAREALGRRLAETGAQAELLEGVARVFGLDESPRRIEVYDNSHTQGTAAQGAMIVAGPEGFIKGAYRRFNIRGGAAGNAPATAPAVTGALDAALGLAEAPAPLPVPGEGPSVPTGGDDYAMMREVFRRRFQRALEEDPSREGETWPDLVLVDGGLGQLNAVRGVLAELGLEDLCVAGIAKGPDRDAGRERFFMPGREPFQLEPRDPVLYFLQRLRDESHRFAIGGHRARRTREAVRSPLDDVPGIGPKRKKALLLHFGSAKAVARAGLSDLEDAPGVSKSVAKKVYDHFHGPG